MQTIHFKVESGILDTPGKIKALLVYAPSLSMIVFGAIQLLRLKTEGKHALGTTDIVWNSVFIAKGIAEFSFICWYVIPFWTRNLGKGVSLEELQHASELDDRKYPFGSGNSIQARSPLPETQRLLTFTPIPESSKWEIGGPRYLAMTASILQLLLAGVAITSAHLSNQFLKSMTPHYHAMETTIVASIFAAIATLHLIALCKKDTYWAEVLANKQVLESYYSLYCPHLS